MFHMKRLLLAFGLCLLPLAAVAQQQTWAPIPPIVSTSAESSHVIKASCDPVAGCRLIDFEVTSTVGGYVLVFDATVAPADGAVTPVKCYQMGAGTLGVQFAANPMKATSGIVLVFSTTGCFTKTASATAFFSAAAL